MSANYTFQTGTSPIVVTAIHDGHQTRADLKDLFNLSDSQRLREEDPFTGKWLNVSDSRIIVHNSRFEVDVNRPRDKAVYMLPEDAWGLQVWKQNLPADIAKVSLQIYDDFYKQCEAYFDSLFTLHEKIIVLDIHSYNHRRDSPDLQSNPADNPEINIGTKNMDRELWDPIVDTLMHQFRSFDYNGRELDVRENIKFKGGYFGQWLYERYKRNICPISIEFKKFFMDEWTGEAFANDILLIDQMLLSSKEPLLEALERIQA